MRFAADLTAILSCDALRWQALQRVRSLALADGWIGAGFVRDAVWDHLHGHGPRPPVGDVDVIWFDRTSERVETDRLMEARLQACDSDLSWSVKNQAHMHLRNGDLPYESTADAMRYWPETATAVAVRLTPLDMLEINAPLGLDDLFAPRLKPTRAFPGDRRAIFDRRVAQKQWLSRYPLLRQEGR